MESWQNERAGRKERFDAFFAEYESELAVGLKGKLLRTEELQSLRKAAAEVERLKDQNVQLGNSLREQQLLREEAAKATKLAEDNARLQQENKRLKESRDRISEELRDRLKPTEETVELEKEVNRLTKELKETRQKLHEARDVQGQQTGKDLLGPDADANTSTTTPISPNAGNPASAREHDKLLVRYNKLCKNHKETEEARKVLEDVLRRRKSERRDWDRLGREQKLELEEKADRISRLEEQIKGLRTQVVELEKCPGTLNPLFVGEERVANPPQMAIRHPARSAPSELCYDSGNDEENDKAVSAVKADESRLVDRDLDQMELGSNLFEDATDNGLPVLDLLSVSASRSARQLRASQNTSLAENTDSDVPSTPFVRLEPESYVNSEDETQGSSPHGASDKQRAAHISERRLDPEACESPEVLEVRRVPKRKRKTDTVNAPPLAKVKTEPLSSSPVGIAAMNSHQDSIDLDEIGERISTPRKKRQFEVYDQATDVLSNQLRDTWEEDHVNKTTEAPFKTPARRTNSVLQPLSPNRSMLPSTSEGKKSERRVTTNKAIESLAEDGEIFQELKSAKKLPPLRQSELSARLENLLEGSSPAKQVFTKPRATALSRQKPGTPEIMSAKSHDGNLALQSVNLTTSGTPAPSSRVFGTSVNGKGSGRDTLSPKKKTYFNQKTPSTASKGRIKTYSLKAKPSIEPQSQSPPTAAYNPADDLQEIKIEPSLSLGSVNRNAPRQSTTTRNQRAKAVEVDSPNNEPFRSRPLQRLSLEHFKINPAYNGGYDYAFTDVVRGKADRACLQGCVKPDCCGSKFRTLAENLYREPVTAQEQEEESHLLNEFVGDDRSKLRNLTPEGRKDLVIQAKIRELSNKYGKHRQQFHRPSSIPGLWDTDFPDTQEDEELRQKQYQRERELVEQRYMEAMRPGGAYLFKDE